MVHTKKVCWSWFTLFIITITRFTIVGKRCGGVEHHQQHRVLPPLVSSGGKRCSPSLFFSASIFTSHSFAPILILASILNKHKHNTNAAISISLFLPLPPSSHLIAFPLSLPPYSHHILWDKKIGCQPRIFNFLFHIVYNEDHLHLIENEGHFASRTRLLFFGGRNVAWLSKWNG